ncbi:peptidoglycan-binding domain-containing protein [Streptomyces erythrogriseus]
MADGQRQRGDGPSAGHPALLQQHTGRLPHPLQRGADGVYGDGTVSAVRWLQANRLGVSADGVYGPDTRAAMLWPDYWRDPSDGSVEFVACYNPPF